MFNPQHPTPPQSAFSVIRNKTVLPPMPSSIFTVIISRIPSFTHSGRTSVCLIWFTDVQTSFLFSMRIRMMETLNKEDKVF